MIWCVIIFTKIWCVTAFFTKCFIKHITSKRPLSTNVCIDVLSDCTVDWMPNYILHMHMDATHYVCVDVFSDYTVVWMLYYTHYKYKGVHQYVCVGVLEDCFSHWMPYYTHHKYNGAHPYVYHRNTCIQHCLHEVVHSECPGKKQRLNIRIYSDRKNNYFYSNVYIK